MKPRPLYKWKSFWLGMLVLVFLGWAWWDSMDCGTLLVPVAGRIAFWNTDACVCFNHSPENFENRMGISRVEGQSDTAFPEIVSYFTDDYSGLYCFVAHWFLMLVFFVPWCAWLFWHWKREQKKLSS